MKHIIYNKLVRDLIPHIIESSGRQPVVQTIDSSAKKNYLQEKLQEEMAEYLESSSLEELADLIEVVHGILDCTGHAWDELEAVRLAKKQQRGGFDKGILLLEVIEP